MDENRRELVVAEMVGKYGQQVEEPVRETSIFYEDELRRFEADIQREMADLSDFTKLSNEKSVKAASAGYDMYLALGIGIGGIGSLLALELMEISLAAIFIVSAVAFVVAIYNYARMQGHASWI